MLVDGWTIYDAQFILTPCFHRKDPAKPVLEWDLSLELVTTTPESAVECFPLDDTG